MKHYEKKKKNKKRKYKKKHKNSRKIDKKGNIQARDVGMAKQDTLEMAKLKSTHSFMASLN